MQQLSWTDDIMLRTESPATPQQIQMLLIYDPSTAAGGKVTFKGILAELDARLHLAKVFRRRLAELPGGLHRPYWVDDPDFDLEYHVRHIGLPQPGDWRQLCIQVARLHARQIDLRRPPWEITVIEGLNAVPGIPEGSFAMAVKLHHCAVDGMASVQMMAAMHDLAANSPRPDGPAGPRLLETPPSITNLLARTLTNVALYPARTGATLAASAPRMIHGMACLPKKLADAAAARTGGLGSPSTPMTRFNHGATPHRVFEARFHELVDFKLIKACVPGATINDVALAYVGGALREYLIRCGELPREPLVVMCPVSLREADDAGGSGNMLFGRLQQLGTDIADPMARLAAITAASTKLRSASTQPARNQMLELASIVPTPLVGFAARAASAIPFAGPTFANTIVTNVPGPTVPIFFCGARLLRVAGLGPLLAGNVNLIHVVASYNGMISISATADRDALPDPGTYAECMENSFHDLLASADSPLKSSGSRLGEIAPGTPESTRPTTQP